MAFFGTAPPSGIVATRTADDDAPPDFDRALFDDDDVVLTPERLERARQAMALVARSSLQWSIILLEEEGWKSIGAVRAVTSISCGAA